MTTSPAHNPTVWVMHAGALGDWVLIWPLLRALARGGSTVVAVSHDSKAHLAAKWIECIPGSIIALPGGIDQPHLSRWWSGPSLADTGMRPSDWRAHAPDRIISFLCDDSTPAGRNWLAAAAADFPGTTIDTVGPPGSDSRAELWSREDVTARGAVARRDNPTGPIICHIGAGSSDKRWPIDRWAALAGTLRAQGHTVHILAGEVEHERFTPAVHTTFSALRGRFIDSFDDLASTTAAARLFIGADTGPTHLAAQLGIPTLALFGPTDPAVWSPAGPSVRLLAPGTVRPMDWLSVDQILAAAIPPAAYTLPR